MDRLSSYENHHIFCVFRKKSRRPSITIVGKAQQMEDEIRVEQERPQQDV